MLQKKNWKKKENGERDATDSLHDPRKEKKKKLSQGSFLSVLYLSPLLSFLVLDILIMRTKVFYWIFFVCAKEKENSLRHFIVIGRVRNVWEHDFFRFARGKKCIDVMQMQVRARARVRSWISYLHSRTFFSLPPKTNMREFFCRVLFANEVQFSRTFRIIRSRMCALVT